MTCRYRLLGLLTVSLRSIHARAATQRGLAYIIVAVLQRNVLLHVVVAPPFALGTAPEGVARALAPYLQ
jgi:hypothetical protein